MASRENSHGFGLTEAVSGQVGLSRAEIDLAAPLLEQSDV